MVYLADLNLEVIYFLQLCQFFVGPTQCQFKKIQHFPLSSYFVLKNQANFDTPSEEIHNPPDTSYYEVSGGLWIMNYEVHN